MKPEAQRIALAKVEGWKETKNYVGDWVWALGDNMKYTRNLPDYLSDLNAVARVEAKLDDELYTTWADNLCMAVHGTGLAEVITVNMAMATAPQRCEALLKTFGLWKEGE